MADIPAIALAHSSSGATAPIPPPIVGGRVLPWLSALLSSVWSWWLDRARLSGFTFSLRHPALSLCLWLRTEFVAPHWSLRLRRPKGLTRLASPWLPAHGAKGRYLNDGGSLQ